MVKNSFLRFFLISLFVFFSFTFFGCTSQRKGGGKKKLVIWHWMTDRNDAFKELAKRYEEETGIKVEFKLFFPPDIYAQKIIAAARAGNLPDIFGILGEKKTLASFIKAGHILDLTSYMREGKDNWEGKFYPQTLRVNIFPDNNRYGVKPGIYGVPIDTVVMQFIYNRKIMNKITGDNDITPLSVDDFIKYAKEANKLGVKGFISGWGEGWLLNALATEWAINLMGEDKFIATIEGKVSYTDKQWLEIFSLFAKLRDSGILSPNIATLSNKEAEDAFAKEKALFSFNGSWAVNVYKQLNPQLDYAFFSLPIVSQEHPVKVWGGAGSSFMVNAKSTNKEEAVKFLKWLTQQKQQLFLIRETNNLPAVKGCEENLPPVLKSLLSVLGNLTHPNFWLVNEDSQVIERINVGLQQIVMGIKSPQKVAEEIQKTKEKVAP